ncbi:MAG: DNA/RNA nuclease SfsA, partial [Candidatus Caldatribacteriaceae bacterium]
SKRFLLSLNNTGRLEEILKEGHEIFFVPHENHKTKGKLIAVQGSGGLCLVDTALHMRAFEVAFEQKFFSWLSLWQGYRRNPRFQKIVLDYLFFGDQKMAYGEIKSALGRRGQLALYPDAPTERGRRHLQLLMELSRQGLDTFIIFAVASPGTVGFTPWKERDREIAELLEKAHLEGVTIKAFSLSIREDGKIFLDNADFPVFLSDS